MNHFYRSSLKFPVHFVPISVPMPSRDLDRLGDDPTKEKPVVSITRNLNRIGIIKMLITVTISMFLGISCSRLDKQRVSFKESGGSRKVASLAPYSVKEYRPKSDKELLNMLETGEAVISKAVYIKNKKPPCFVDTVNKKKLIPKFAHPASRSSIAFKKRFPICSRSTENHIASLTPGMVPKGTQVAWSPVVIGGVSAVMGCFISVLSDNNKLKVAGLVGSVAAMRGVLDNILAAGIENVSTKQIAGRMLLGGGGGAMAGILGALICGTVVAYFVEGKYVLSPPLTY